MHLGHRRDLDGRGRRGLASYLEHGYIPLDDPVREAIFPSPFDYRTQSLLAIPTDFPVPSGEGDRRHGEVTVGADWSLIAEHHRRAGQPMSAAVALENLNIFEEEGLNERVRTLSPVFRSTLEKLNDLPECKAARDKGDRDEVRYGDPTSPWAIADGWRLGHGSRRSLAFGHRDQRLGHRRAMREPSRDGGGERAAGAVVAAGKPRPAVFAHHARAGRQRLALPDQQLRSRQRPLPPRPALPSQTK